MKTRLVAIVSPLPLVACGSSAHDTVIRTGAPAGGPSPVASDLAKTAPSSSTTALWVGPKSDTPYVPPSSCPREETVGLTPNIYGGFQSPVGGSFVPTSEAEVQISSGDYIVVMAGSVRSRPDFGDLLFIDVPADPCAAAIRGAPRSPTSLFRVTAANGPVLLTAVSGTTVVLHDASGSRIIVDVAAHTGLTPDSLD
jgi:hypothetical protein